MDPWSNINASSQDTEIAEINQLENTLGDIPSSVRKIRELITRFEICHFKYRQHIQHIQTSILDLDPAADPDTIGSNHIRNGENAWINDKTGRSLTGQQYLWGLYNWLGNTNRRPSTEDHSPVLESRISTWLGDKTPDKERMVRLLIARLTYDWVSYEKLQLSGQFKELEYQTCRMDICHYAFPDHLDSLIQAIGNMKPHNDLEGCGSFTTEIKKCIAEKYAEIVFLIRDILKSPAFCNQNKNDRFKTWLYLCLAKTLKEQAGITEPLPVTDN